MAWTVCAVAVGGCQTQSPRASPEEVFDVRAGHYGVARRALRPHAMDRRSPDVLLDNLRLAVASLHDGAFVEAEQALVRAYPFMVSGTVNDSARQSAATFTHESVLVWRGEPFEQAMGWYYQAVAQMMKGDWENARAAARNMQFTLTDFAGGGGTIGQVMDQAESPEWFDENADEVESDLVLAPLIGGVAERWQGREADSGDFFQRARELREDLAPLIDELQHGDYNTLLIVEAGNGPRKVARGDSGQYFTYEPSVFAQPDRIRVATAGVGRSPVEAGDLPRRLDAVDTWELAQHPRWWSMRSLRETKKAVGDVLSIGGWGAVIVGSGTSDDNVRDKAILGGIAAIALGEAFKSGSAADLRCFDVLPRTVYFVPLKLEPGPNTVAVRVDADAGSQAIRHYIMPGLETPAVYVLRLSAEAESAWAEDQATSGAGWVEIRTAMPEVVHPNDVTGPFPGTYPYILGGTCVCRPTREVLEAYQAGGFLLEYNIEELRDLYRAEGIVEVPLPPGPTAGATYRHVLDGGLLLSTPAPGSVTFERLTFTPAEAYQPRSALVREAAKMLRASDSN